MRAAPSPYRMGTDGAFVQFDVVAIVIILGRGAGAPTTGERRNDGQGTQGLTDDGNCRRGCRDAGAGSLRWVVELFGHCCFQRFGGGFVGSVSFGCGIFGRFISYGFRNRFFCGGIFGSVFRARIGC